MRCPSCDTHMLKEFVDGAWVWRCLICAVMLDLYQPGQIDPNFEYEQRRHG